MAITKLNENYWVSPQLTLRDIETAASDGVELIINNRPDGESEDQPLSSDLAKRAEELGMQFVSNMYDFKTLTQHHVDVQGESIALGKKTLSFCRTGTRSSVLWVLSEVKLGGDYSDLRQFVEAKGFDLSRCEAAMSQFA
ncbi:TIGR01244 family sulfur transferase [Marinomonas mediterranea]|jgi:conserved hypothetical protein TIGR01244|uniref:Beta-lactamase hydrolase-family protein n=1 Tax=Marinomonas mediterranea (strain ATCC 700492 / JCM 21426 / NBRC 103028 / MMB-1) TaxID=717774 RepID=F2JVV5_MARM1|nr:TIGR01244 family sulfur transferase [Marinomonas mediterranea]ADZ91741.1 Beta-lactamase hydrolase-family protein [Marinomonas mediterranea MMB-1]WCN17837.1 TIGR01244 family phosphatase [Marinomonas mediterranea MMB-1]